MPVGEDGTYYINRLGLHCFDDVLVYCAGDRLICWPPDTPPDRFKITEVPPRRLAINGALNKRDAFEGMKEVVGLSPDAGRILLAHSISSITRSAYLKSHVTPSTILELISKHGTFKSTYSSFTTQLYDRDEEITPVTRMNSSPRFIEEILHEYSECTVVIDDMHPADAQSIMKNNEATAEDIIRRVGDNSGRGRMEGNAMIQRNPRGNAVFTGEYSIFKGSTAARSLVVSFTTPIDRKRLHKCQQQPLTVSTFYRFFIEWFVEHYHDIVDSLAEKLAKHREYDTGISPRLWETQFCLQTSYMMFLQFCLDNVFISTETARDEYVAFCTLLTSLVKAQNARINPDEPKSSLQIDYCKLLCELYKGDRFHLAKGKDHFDRKEHDGLKYDDLLCLRSDSLLKRIQKIVPSATLSNIRDALIAKSALKLDGESKNVKIPIIQDGTLNQLRFYGIYINKLR